MGLHNAKCVLCWIRFSTNCNSVCFMTLQGTFRFAVSWMISHQHTVEVMVVMMLEEKPCCSYKLFWHIWPCIDFCSSAWYFGICPYLFYPVFQLFWCWPIFRYDLHFKIQLIVFICVVYTPEPMKSRFPFCVKCWL